MPSYRVELHSHCQGDPVDLYLRHSVSEHIDRARAAGLDALAITWHRKIFSDADAVAYARERGLLLISGMEAEIGGRHLVVLNLEPGDLPGETSWDEIRALRRRRPQVFIIAPHPFYPHPSCLGENLRAHADCVDAVEWCRLHVGWLPDRVNPNLRAARWAHAHSKPLVACSDAHSPATIGRNASTVEAEALTPVALFDAIRAGRISFHRHSLDLPTLARESGKVIVSQPRQLGRWMAERWKRRRPHREDKAANWSSSRA